MLLFPVLALAQESMTFAPPPSDLSVIFLGNLFGSVDGVLHGSGSQIMGAMFSVFNSAVLALGGMIITYTLLVSTMNTAHEGQMLGQKWSSIWIPVRSTVGLTLLIPKASGYCMMQIFVMWIVIQGVGAADKIWGAALSYLNRGGVIVKAQPSTAFDLLEKDPSGGVAPGAAVMLTGQVCMLGLQKQLEAQRKTYLEEKQKNAGACYNATGSIKTFCDSAVPDFISSVNAVAKYNENKKAPELSLAMPNFAAGSPYASLNGICGLITWKSQIDGMTSDQAKIVGLSGAEFETLSMSRSIAVQQLYNALTPIAQIMVNNDPEIAGGSAKPLAGVSVDAPQAIQQYGVPYTKTGAVCNSSKENCTRWGPYGSGSVLFNGTEFQGAINEYNGVMEPALNMLALMKNNTKAQNSRKFILEANAKGWIMAGSYFFDLIKLQGSANSRGGDSQIDQGSNLSNSRNDLSSLKGEFNNKCAAATRPLCTWFDKDETKIDALLRLIQGSGLSKPNFESIRISGSTLIPGGNASSVYGFISNSLMMTLPGQVGNAAPTFQNKIDYKLNTDIGLMKEISFPCGEIRIVFFTVCIGQLIGNLFYNTFIRYVFNAFQAVFQTVFSQLFALVLIVPLSAMSTIFRDGVDILSLPGVNPVVALANMGTMYINFAGDLWMTFLNAIIQFLIVNAGIFIVTLGFGTIPYLAIVAVIMILLAICMPIIMTWLSVMVIVSFITAYYVPLVPYIIFTFGTIAWFICVIEAMVAAPIVALGVTHPEGHDAFGKGESAVMILMNVFLRPSMMIIGYISGIALSYVGIWLLNAGFNHVVGFMTSGGDAVPHSNAWGYSGGDQTVWKPAGGDGGSGFGGKSLYGEEGENSMQTYEKNWAPLDRTSKAKAMGGISDGGYTGWASIFAYFFAILSYTTLYMIIAQKSFQLIVMLPDRVLRWIGGSQENIGEQAAGWGDEVKQKHSEMGSQVQGAMAQTTGKIGGDVGKAASQAGDAVKGAISTGKTVAEGAAALGVTAT